MVQVVGGGVGGGGGLRNLDIQFWASLSSGQNHIPVPQLLQTMLYTLTWPMNYTPILSSHSHPSPAQPSPVMLSPHTPCAPQACIFNTQVPCHTYPTRQAQPQPVHTHGPRDSLPQTT